MKCARCDHDSTYPQRTGGICPGCQKHFAFEPRTGDPVADMGWKSAIDWVSSNGTVRFTEDHLHHAIARRVKRKSAAAVVGFGLGALGLAIAAVGGSAGSAPAGIFGSLVMFTAIIAAAYMQKAAFSGLTLTRGEFDSLFRRWVSAHGTPKGLIAPRGASRPLTPEMKHELASYSFDRAVICDRPETVDVLLANDFHFENNCAVLTAGGYPEHAAPLIRTMLDGNPRLEVFVLHDATVEGCVLAHELRHSPDWFGGKAVRVFDVALRPAQAMAHTTLHWDTPRDPGSHPAITPGEARWLATRSMRLAAFSPEQIIKRLFRAMQHLPEVVDAPGGDGINGSTGDVILWNADATTSDGGADSFG